MRSAASPYSEAEPTTLSDIFICLNGSIRYSHSLPCSVNASFFSSLRLSLELFAPQCSENRSAVFEIVSDGEVLAKTPTGCKTSCRNIELAFHTQRFARSGTTWNIFASFTGFRLSSDSVPTPGAMVS